MSYYCCPCCCVTVAKVCSCEPDSECWTCKSYSNNVEENVEGSSESSAVGSSLNSKTVDIHVDIRWRGQKDKTTILIVPTVVSIFIDADVVDVWIKACENPTLRQYVIYNKLAITDVTRLHETKMSLCQKVSDIYQKELKYWIFFVKQHKGFQYSSSYDYTCSSSG